MARLDDFDWKIEDYERRVEECEKILSKLEDWSEIPTINCRSLDTMSDGCLARYQGMIQEIFNPEYFLKKYNVVDKNTRNTSSRCGKFRDLLPFNESEEVDIEDETNIKDQEVRHPFFCIPIPGINSWANTYSQQKQTLNGESSHQSGGLKRSYQDDDDMEVDEDRKIHSKTPKDNQLSNHIYSCEEYFPLPETSGLPCIVKYYGDPDDFLVNMRIEVVGFLSLSPALEATWQDCDAEDRAMHPPPSQVPRLHALRIRKLSHCNPLLPLAPQLDALDSGAGAIRSDLHTVLTQLVCGDTLAADYLICNLLSTVYVRMDGLALGALSLNFFNILDIPDYPKHLFKFLQSLVPSSAYMPLSVDFLNTSTFVPRKDYETNKLLSGRLQLADDTHLLVDETVMTAGQLGEVGLRNMAALHALSKRQELRYDFTYFQVDFHTNVPVLVLSEGKSMIPVDFALKVLPESGTKTSMAETFEAARFFMSGPRLDAVRKYLSILRLQDCDMTSTDFVGQAWADLRQEHSYLNQYDLHRLLVLSRLLALSAGRRILGREDWNKAVSMELQCRARVSSSL